MRRRRRRGLTDAGGSSTNFPGGSVGGGASRPRLSQRGDSSGDGSRVRSMIERRHVTLRTTGVAVARRRLVALMAATATREVLA